LLTGFVCTCFSGLLWRVFWTAFWTTLRLLLGCHLYEVGAVVSSKAQPSQPTNQLTNQPSPQPFDKTTNNPPPTPQVVEALKRGKQVMVFVHSRKETGKTGRVLAELAAKVGGGRTGDGAWGGMLCTGGWLGRGGLRMTGWLGRRGFLLNSHKALTAPRSLKTHSCPPHHPPPSERRVPPLHARGAPPARRGAQGRQKVGGIGGWGRWGLGGAGSWGLGVWGLGLGCGGLGVRGLGRGGKGRQWVEGVGVGFGGCRA
jgi:hypothetical protein